MGNNAASSFLSRLREYVGDRRRAPRRGARFAASVPAVLTLLEAGEGSASDVTGSPTVACETRDLGTSGLTVLVDRVRVGGQYLTDAEYRLGVRLELPAGEVSMLAKAVRFEQANDDGAGPGYILGLRILKVTETDFALYSNYLRTLEPSERRRGERASGRQRVLELATQGIEITPRE